MAKSTMGTKLPRKLEQKMQVVGEQIKLARLPRPVLSAASCDTAPSFRPSDNLQRRTGDWGQSGGLQEVPVPVALHL